MLFLPTCVVALLLLVGCDRVLQTRADDVLLEVFFDVDVLEYFGRDSGDCASQEIYIDFPSIPSYTAVPLSSPPTSTTYQYEIFRLPSYPTDIRFTSKTSDAICITWMQVNNVDIIGIDYTYPDAWLQSPTETIGDITAFESITWQIPYERMVGYFLDTSIHTCAGSDTGSNTGLQVTIPEDEGDMLVSNSHDNALTTRLYITLPAFPTPDTWFNVSLIVSDYPHSLIFTSESSDGLCMDAVVTNGFSVVPFGHTWYDDPCVSGTVATPEYDGYCTTRGNVSTQGLFLPSGEPSAMPTTTPSLSQAPSMTLLPSSTPTMATTIGYGLWAAPVDGTDGVSTAWLGAVALLGRLLLYACCLDHSSSDDDDEETKERKKERNKRITSYIDLVMEFFSQITFLILISGGHTLLMKHGSKECDIFSTSNFETFDNFGPRNLYRASGCNLFVSCDDSFRKCDVGNYAWLNETTGEVILTQSEWLEEDLCPSGGLNGFDFFSTDYLGWDDVNSYDDAEPAKDEEDPGPFLALLWCTFLPYYITSWLNIRMEDTEFKMFVPVFQAFAQVWLLPFSMLSSIDSKDLACDEFLEGAVMAGSPYTIAALSCFFVVAAGVKLCHRPIGIYALYPGIVVGSILQLVAALKSITAPNFSLLLGFGVNYKAFSLTLSSHTWVSTFFFMTQILRLGRISRYWFLLFLNCFSGDVGPKIPNIKFAGFTKNPLADENANL